MNWQDELRAITAEVPAGDLPDLVAELARLDVLARQRLAQDNGAGAPAPVADRSLTSREVAAMLSVSKQWVYAHQRELGGRKLDGAVRFSDKAVQRYLQATTKR